MITKTKISKCILSSNSFTYGKQKNSALHKYGSEYNLNSLGKLRDAKVVEFSKLIAPVKSKNNSNKPKLVSSVSVNLESTENNSNEPVQKYFSSFDENLLLKTKSASFDATSLSHKYNRKSNSSLHCVKERRNVFKTKKRLCKNAFGKALVLEENTDLESKIPVNSENCNFYLNQDTAKSHVSLKNELPSTVKSSSKTSNNLTADKSTSNESTLTSGDDSRVRSRNSWSGLRQKILSKKLLKKVAAVEDEMEGEIGIEYSLDLVSKSKISDLPIKSILHKT